MDWDRMAGCADPRGETGLAGFSTREVNVPITPDNDLTGSQILRWAGDIKRPVRCQISLGAAPNLSANQDLAARGQDIYVRCRFQIGEAIYTMLCDWRPGGTVFGILASMIDVYIVNRNALGAFKATGSIVPGVPEAPPPTMTILQPISGAGPPFMTQEIPDRARLLTLNIQGADVFAYEWLNASAVAIGGGSITTTLLPVPIIVPAGARYFTISDNPTGLSWECAAVYELDT